MHTISPIPHATFERTVDVCGDVRFAIVGDLHFGWRDQLERAAVADIEAGARALVIDFARCGYMDSAGLKLMVNLTKRLRELGGSLVLDHLNEEALDLLRLTRLDTVLVFRA